MRNIILFACLVNITSASLLPVTLIPEPISQKEVEQIYTRKLMVKGSYPQETFRLHLELNEILFAIPLTLKKEFTYPIELREGKNIIRVVAFNEENEPLGEFKKEVEYIKPYISKILEGEVLKKIKEKGGEITAPDGTKLSFPPGVLKAPISLTIEVIDNNNFPQPLTSEIELSQRVFKFTPLSLEFSQPVKAELVFRREDFKEPLSDDKFSRLKIFYWTGKTWLAEEITELNPNLNQGKRIVAKCYFTHLGIFTLGLDFRKKETPSRLRVFLTKNPFKLGQGTNFVVTTPRAGKITIKIYNLGNDRVRLLCQEKPCPKAGKYVISWHGLNDFGRYIESGIYVYKVEFKTERKLLSKTALIGVIR
jgi:hypothetical protein